MNGGQTPLEKLKAVDWRGLVRTATNKVKQYTMNLSPLEIQVEEATNMDTWGPHGSVMSDIAEACYDAEGYRQVLGVLARRLQEKDEHWRMCYKALLLLEFLVKQGPPKIADDVASSMSVLERLQRFEFKDANGRDHGQNVRHRAQEISQLVTDPPKLRDEREKARANKAKYKGVSAADMRNGSGFGGGSSGGGGGGRRGFDPSSLVRPGESKRGPSSFAAATGGNSGSNNSSSYNNRSFGSDSFGGGGGGSRNSSAAAPSYSGGGGFESLDSPSSRSGGGGDPVAATRARIEQLKLQERSSSSAAAARSTDDSTAAGKKKLTDVKVNPKIAASLGLKLAPPPSAKSSNSGITSASAYSAPANVDEVDLLGGLDDPEPITTAAAPAAATTTSGGGWDAFRDVGTASTATTTTTAAQPSEVFDPFAPSPTISPTVAARKPISPSAPANAAAASRPALPEDIFADLTGLVKPVQPMGGYMGHASGVRAAPAAVSLSGGASPSAATGAGAPVVEFGFADFGSANNNNRGAPASGGGGKDPFANLLS